MVQRRLRIRASTLALAACVSAAGAALAQQGPVAAMFRDDQQRGQSTGLSFATMEMAPTTAASFPAQIYLTAGDLERAFDRSQFRPDGAIVPTNTELAITAAAPATQRVLIDRVRRNSDVLRDLQDQIEARRKQSKSAPGQAGLLEIGVDTFTAQLPRNAGSKQGGAFPRAVCLIATDFPKGGAIDRRELFAQDRVRKGVAACLESLDASGVRSVALPLMGAASSGTQARDPRYEGQSVLKECRLLNSVAGIALGIHDFAPGRRRIREIGIVQWDQEIREMFSLPQGTRLSQTAQNTYRVYAEQITSAFRRGLAGEKTTSSDIDGSCTAILNAQ
jgi:O-acetyl-ADP-ribose deacetylase (regulator of RNase III)